MLLLLLAACGYPSYYPNSTYWGVFDTAGDDTAPAEIPCGERLTADPVELRTVSNASVPLVLYERTDCSERLIGELSRSAVTSVPTNPGVIFVARTESGETYDWTQVPYGSDMYPWEVR